MNQDVQSKEESLKRLTVILTICLSSGITVPALAQQIDVGFAGGSISSASASQGSSTGIAAFNPSERGGTFIGFNGDVIFYHNLGIEGEVNWRASQGLYAGVVPYRPIFYDFNAIYSKQFSKRVGAEALAGIGGESIRFYTGSYNCDFYGNCTNYVGSNHFLADFGGGIRLYAWRSLFVRPEVRLYMIPNNQEFSSDFVVRYGASIGYTFGGNH